MKGRRDKFEIIRNIVIVVIVLAIGYFLYSKYNFNDYTKAELKRGMTNFERDGVTKYEGDSQKISDSYKIENTDFTDAMFFKEIDVIPNTPYKVTCMVKTLNVESENENTDSGAHICLNSTTEKSDNITGSTDWTQLTFYFNSKSETKAQIGFRLGGYADNCKGVAWFSNFTIESGVEDTSNTWNYLCLLLDNIDVNIDVNGSTRESIEMLTAEDKSDIINCMSRFKSTLSTLSKGKMNAEYDVIEVNTPVTTISHDNVNGYYIDPIDVAHIVDSYLDKGIYDHVFLVFRTSGNASSVEIPIDDWIGLGGMQYRGVGFSNIRLPEDNDSYIYKYSSSINTFPEEVLLHEFLHTLERNAKEWDYEIPELHSYANYNYQNERLCGLKQWYADYINCEIKSSDGTYVGLPETILYKKPVKESNFEYAQKLDYLNEPNDIIQQFNIIYKKIVNLFTQNKTIQSVKVEQTT